MNISNRDLRTIINDASKKMPSVNLNSKNPIETLSVEDLVYLQKYLEHIKIQKIKQNNTNKTTIPINRANEIYDPINREIPVDWRDWRAMESNPIYNQHNTEPGSRGSSSTRIGKKSQQNLGSNDYYNPYECGSRQDSLNVPILKPYNGPYNNNTNTLNNMGIHDQQISDHIRNINIESSLMQREMTHLPGQREITEKNFNRFNLLPFDPQDDKHIIWSDNMPRGGYSTRNDKLNDECEKRY
ncbi:hypothetical protein H012_gp577 [Acanthamoeba polyphaga moumouvirus]|uniref:Uncharacterized protein n=2 Tax=Moumouvirus TaxID=3080801 RepID=L7RCC6_9VIRU|nr:hypothetical protein H012_gp577 [Acanthamoeba polyphaga moumouvirus]AEX62882.1 hypothetical protein mv_R677 [Moumouvirus Monve]AGC01886.1 hypothetical protein Moumou_00346 [Acanthamoeba polyphaga moumouvirus]AQN68245.1 hypothetical protein [Saudi moumouvirus]